MFFYLIDGVLSFRWILIKSVFKINFIILGFCGCLCLIIVLYFICFSTLSHERSRPVSDTMKDRIIELLAKRADLRRSSDDDIFDLITKIFAIIGAAAVIAAFVYGIYRLLSSKYVLEEDDEYDDDFVDEELETD